MNKYQFLLKKKEEGGFMEGETTYDSFSKKAI